MTRLVIVVALFLPLPLFAKLEIKNVQPAHGVLGPPRASDDVYPLDEYVVRYQIAGLKLDKDGKADLEVDAKLIGPDGKPVFDRKSRPVSRPLSLGGDILPSFGYFTIPAKAPPGEYKFTVTVVDRISKESASFERKLTCKPTTFQILMPRFFHDSANKVPAGTTMLLGETLYYTLKVVGYDKNDKKVSLVMRATILDRDGKDIGAKALEVRGDITDPEKAAGSRQATINGLAGLNRTGEFKLHIVVEDTLGKKTATFETPLKVLAP